MTNDQRREAIKQMITDYTKANTQTKEQARAVLVKEGVYDAKGRLTPEFGGKKRAGR